MAVAASVPGMVVETGAPRGSTDLAVSRAAPNVWWMALGPEEVAEGLSDPPAEKLLPSEVLAGLALRGARGAAVLAKVEIDVCGAWLTVANAGPARPLLVRRAGWVDLRGHPSPPLGEAWTGADDRIGLGPADMLLLRRGSSVGDSDASADDTLFDLALRAAGSDPIELVTQVCGDERRQACVGVGVPADLGANPLERVARATGIPAEKLQTPGYPLGDLQPDLWKAPPPPPRLARLRLTQDRATVRVVRSLLDRLLASWRLDGRVDEVELKLVATELAANAVVHTGSPDTITITYLGESILVDVRDNSVAQPEPRAESLVAEGGRGMRVVETLSSSWGVDLTSQGKKVWCELQLSPA